MPNQKNRIDKNKNIIHQTSNENVYVDLDKICRGFSLPFDRFNPSISVDDIKHLLTVNGNDYRLQYATISKFMMKNLDTEDKMQNFLLNVEELKNHCEKNKNEIDGKVYKIVKKLCDHVNLSSNQISFIQENLCSYSSQLREETKLTISANSTSMQKDYVSILGIFAAVVLAFNGGMSMMANAFTSLAESNTFNVLLVLLVSGLILGDVLFIMLYVIGRITDKDIFAVKITNEELKSKSIKEKIENSWFNKVRINLPYIFYFNAILLVLIILLLVFIFFGVYNGNIVYIKLKP